MSFLNYLHPNLAQRNEAEEREDKGFRKNNFNIYDRIGMRLRDARKNKDLSQLKLSQMVGVARTSIVNIEKGNQKLPIDLLCAICSALDIDICSCFKAFKKFGEE